MPRGVMCCLVSASSICCDGSSNQNSNRLTRVRAPFAQIASPPFQGTVLSIRARGMHLRFSE